MIDELEYQRLKQELEALKKAVHNVTAFARAESAVEFSSKGLFYLIDEIRNEVGVSVPPFIIDKALVRLGLRDVFGDELVDKAKQELARREHVNG